MDMKILLRKLKLSDIKYFSKWWRDKDLLKLTSGILKLISDKEIEKYFNKMLNDKKSQHYLIILGDKKAIGHIVFHKSKNKSAETQIIIGEKEYWGKGYGTVAINLALKKIQKYKYKKIYLEVRPNNLRAIMAYKKCSFKSDGFKKYPKNKFLPVVLKMSLVR
jgi:RimJ/RimL family protein N-acetyltransferase